MEREELEISLTGKEAAQRLHCRAGSSQGLQNEQGKNPQEEKKTPQNINIGVLNNVRISVMCLGFFSSYCHVPAWDYSEVLRRGRAQIPLARFKLKINLFSTEGHKTPW